jgi:hypothetical protein
VGPLFLPTGGTYLAKKFLSTADFGDIFNATIYTMGSNDKKRKRSGDATSKPKKKVVIDAAPPTATVSSVLRPKFCPPVIGTTNLLLFLWKPDRRAILTLRYSNGCWF